MKTKSKPLISILALAKKTGCDRKVIAGVVKAKGITPKAMPSNGKAKGLDPSDVRIVCRTLNLSLKAEPRGANAAASA